MFGGGRCLCPQLELLPKGFKLNTTVRRCAVPKKSDLGIKIPPRIERGPTDILKALSVTVKQDNTAQHYKYPDDPFLSAVSNLFKRRMALALESGRKSARWIFENNPGFFNAEIAEPLIKAYLQKPVYNEESEVTEDTLKDVIEDRNVKDAMILYDNFQKKGIEISKDTKQLLLELVCFYNCEEKPNEEDLEMKWFKTNRKEQPTKTWKDNGFAERLFESIGSDCPLAVSAIIQGRLKYNQTEKAVELFDYARESNMKLPVGVYNGLLSKVFIIKEGPTKWEYTEELLREMAAKNVQPNLFTLNAVLETVFKMGNWRGKEKVMWNVVGEFKKLGIEPSLGTYYYIINILYGSKTSGYKDEMFLTKILRCLLDQKLELRHPSDLFFFPSVMYIVASNLKSLHLSHTLNDLLMSNGNQKFMSTNIELYFYYRHYFTLIFESEPIEMAMEIYQNIVPSRYSPEIGVFECILRKIDASGAFEFLPKIVEDLKEQRYYKQPKILETLLNMFSLCDIDKEGETLNILYEVANFSYRLIEGERFQMLDEVRSIDVFYSNLLIIFVKKEDHTKALSIFNKINEENCLLDINATAASKFLNYCISKQNLSLILECLKYVERKKYPEATQMAADSLPHLSGLPEKDLKWVTDLANSSESKQSNEVKPEEKKS